MRAKNVNLRKESLFERLIKSGEWLRWVVQNILRTNGMVLEKPKWLEDKNVLLVDGSDISLKGSSGSDYRLHMMFDLFNFCYKSLEITTALEGERMERFKPEANSILIGDRGYVSVKGMEYAIGNKSSFILRYRARAFNLYAKGGRKLDLVREIGVLKEWEHKSINCFYLSGTKLKPLRICVMRKDQKAISASERQLKVLCSKKQIETRKPDTVELNKYIVLCTNLEYDAEKIFELYRCRWQIELVFKELKTTLSFGEVPSSNPDSVKAWFYGKLLIAAISLLILNESLFSPKA